MKKIAMIGFLILIFVISTGFSLAEDNSFTGFIFGSLDVSETQQTLSSISFVKYPSPALIGDFGLPHDIKIKLVPEKGLFYAVDVAPDQYYLHAFDMRQGKYSSKKTYAYYCMNPKDQDLITVNGGRIVYFGSYRFKTLKKDRLFAPGSFALEKQNNPSEKELLEKLLTLKDIKGSKWESQIKERLMGSSDVEMTNDNATSPNNLTNNEIPSTVNPINGNSVKSTDLTNDKTKSAVNPINDKATRNSGFLFGALDISETKQTLLSISFLRPSTVRNSVILGLPRDFVIKLVPEKGLFYAVDVVPNQYYLYAFDMRAGKYASGKNFAYYCTDPKDEDLVTIKGGQIVYFGSYRFKTIKKDRLFALGSFTLEKQDSPNEKELLQKLLTLKEIQGSKWETQLKERLENI